MPRPSGQICSNAYFINEVLLEYSHSHCGHIVCDCFPAITAVQQLQQKLYGQES